MVALISINIGAMFFKLGARNVHQKCTSGKKQNDTHFVAGSSVLHCASLLHTNFASLARANVQVHVHDERNFPQAKLDSEIKFFLF